MTISTTHSSNSFTGDSSTKVFNFTFSVLVTAPGVDVYVAGIKQTAGFTTSVNTDQSASPGGYVTFDTAPTNGTVVLLQRNTNPTQETGFPLESKLNTAALETALDKTVLLLQENERDIAARTFVWRGTWSAAATYQAGEAVYYNGATYICVGTNVTAAPGTASWNTLAGSSNTLNGLVWRGTWNSATTYAINDGVTLNGGSYIAIAGNTNSQPPSANWATLAAKGDVGAANWTVSTKNANFNASSTFQYYIITSSCTVTLPACTGSGNFYRFVVNSGVLTFAFNGTDKVRYANGTQADDASLTLNRYQGVLELLDAVSATPGPGRWHQS